MIDYQFSILTDEPDIIDYEKKMFDSFTKLHPDNWLCKNYELVNDCRYRSNIPYKDQIIYAIKKSNKIISAMAINLNIYNKLQLEEIGFILSEENKNSRFCEALNLYASEELGDEFFKVFITLGENMQLDLQKRKIETMYSTCSKKLKTMYTLFGMEVIDKLTIGTENKYLLKYDLE